jgi:hypothetical protein
MTDVQVDAANWSGEGLFTQLLVERLQRIAGVSFVRVEDAPATRAEADYNFISNEIFVSFASTVRSERVIRWGFIPGSRTVLERAMSLERLESALAQIPEVGQPDYSDDSMLQYLRTERVVPPYQTRGYKLVELVRIYEVGREPRDSREPREPSQR